jgi:hypothetical protein
MFIIIITGSITFIILFYGVYCLNKKIKKRTSKIQDEPPVSIKKPCSWLKHNSSKKHKLHTIFETKEEHETSNEEKRKPSIII